MEDTISISLLCKLNHKVQKNKSCFIESILRKMMNLPFVCFEKNWHLLQDYWS